jgi:hypothetical protein
MSNNLNQGASIEAERAAFEVESRPYLDLTPCTENDGYMAYSTYCAWRAWQAARRTAPVSAPLDTQALRPIDKLPPFPEKKAGYLEQGAHGVFLAYSWNPAAETRALFTEDQYRQGQRDAIAPYAERIRHLERELAERKPASVDTPEFQKLAWDWAGKMHSKDAIIFANHEPLAWEKLIAYIDGRTAGTAPDGYVLAPKEPTEAMVHAAEDLPPPRMFGVVYRTMIAAAPTPINSGREETNAN